MGLAYKQTESACVVKLFPSKRQTFAFRSKPTCQTRCRPARCSRRRRRRMMMMMRMGMKHKRGARGEKRAKGNFTLPKLLRVRTFADRDRFPPLDLRRLWRPGKQRDPSSSWSLSPGRKRKERESRHCIHRCHWHLGTLVACIHHFHAKKLVLFIFFGNSLKALIV